MWVSYHSTLLVLTYFVIVIGTCVIILRCNPAAASCQCRYRGAVALIRLPKGLWGIILPPLWKVLWVLCWKELQEWKYSKPSLYFLHYLNNLTHQYAISWCTQEHLKPHPHGMPANLDKARPLVGAPFPSLAFLCCLEGWMETKFTFPVQMISWVIQQAKSKTKTLWWYFECLSMLLHT